MYYYRIAIIFIIIIFILIFYYLYNLNKNNIQKESICILKNKFNKLTPIITPADYILINDEMTENKFNKSEKMLKMIGVKDDLLIKLLNISKFS